MRYLAILMVSGVLVGFFSGPASSVGYYVVGKDCQCCPLTAKGIVPDTLNTFKYAFTFPWLISTLDVIAIEARTLLGQMGVGSTSFASMPSTEEPKDTTKKKEPEVSEKPQTSKESPADPNKKQPRKITRKTKVKVPPRAL